jgi:hypothetical protein
VLMEGTIPPAGDGKHPQRHYAACMADRTDPIRARFSAEAPQLQVVSALLVVAGAQAGLPVERIDDAVMGLDLRQGVIELSVGEVDEGRLEAQRQMLEVLATAVDTVRGTVRLRVEP